MTLRWSLPPSIVVWMLGLIAAASAFLLTLSLGSAAAQPVPAGKWTMRVLVDHAMPIPESDGLRWVAIHGGNPADPAGGFVYDTLTGKLTQTPLPGQCSPSHIGVSGVLLLGCQSPDRYLRGYVLDLRSGTMREVPHVIPSTVVGFRFVGRRWVVYAESCDPETFDCVQIAVNLRTGQRRPYRSLRMNLDSTDLRPLPRPSYSTSTRNTGRTGSTLWLVGPNHRRILLDRCPRDRCEGQVSAGRVTWSEGLVAKGYVISSGRRYSHRFAAIAGTGPRVSVSHTRYRVIVMRDGGNDVDGAHATIYQARW